MEAFKIFDISASAMFAQRERMNVLASNMANAHTTKTEEGTPYIRKDVLFTSIPLPSNPAPLYGVGVYNVINDNSPFKVVYQPGHPDADKDGFVKYPNVDVVKEMVNMMMAMRAYEASASAFNISKTMYMKLLELGRV
jgi:flagellar basal-body rod protein FlgC